MMRDRGTFTLYDALLFFVFLMMASAILSVYAGYPSQGEFQRSTLYNQCMETRRAVMSSTIPVTYYELDETRIYREDLSVRQLLLEQVYLEMNGVPRESFDYPWTIRSLVNGHTEHNWAMSISCGVLDDLIIYRGGVRHDISDIRSLFRGNTVSSGFVETGLCGENIHITFYIFV